MVQVPIWFVSQSRLATSEDGCLCAMALNGCSPVWGVHGGLVTFWPATVTPVDEATVSRPAPPFLTPVPCPPNRYTAMLPGLQSGGSPLPGSDALILFDTTSV